MAIDAILISNSSGISGGGTPAPAPPDVTAITVTGFIDPRTDNITLTVGVTPAGTLGSFIGCHIWLRVPDPGSTGTFTVGVSALDGTDGLVGQPFLIDCGDQVYVASQQPWTVSVAGPSGLSAMVDNPAMLYAPSISSLVDNKLVLAGNPGASPSQSFTLVSLASGSPTSGTNITTLTGDDNSPIGIVATALAPVNVTGKLETPVEVLLTSTPPNTNGWVSRLVVTIGAAASAAPNLKTNQQVIPGYITEAGPVYAPAGDGISVPHSFALDTPTAFTSAVVWLQAGLLQNGVYAWNNIVPGITPSFGFTYGSTTGTTDATAIMTATIAASMAIVNNLFGVAAAGITNALLGSGAVATINVQNLAITNPLLASLAVQAANLATGSVTSTAIAALAVGTGAIQTAAITNALIANLAVSGAQIQSATITGANIASATIAGANIGTATIAQANMANASIGTAQIQNLAVTDALINDCSISKLTAGSATFTGTATFTGSGGDYIQINSTGILLQGAGSNIFMQISSSGLTISGAASSYVQLNSSGMTLQASSSAFVTIDASTGEVTCTASGTSTQITGNTLVCGTVTTANLHYSVSFAFTGLPFSTATAGSNTLPSNPAGFIPITVSAASCKIPYYFA